MLRKDDDVADNKGMLIRTIFFLSGLWLVSMGIAFCTHGGLGSTPIAAIPYSVFLVVPGLSFGTWIFLYNLLLIVIEMLLLRPDFRWKDIALQCFLAGTFGSLTDFSMFLVSFLTPGAYWLQIGFVILGSLILAAGAILTIIGRIGVLPADAFVLAIAYVSRREYGTIRLLSDMGMSVMGMAICWVTLHTFQSVREGTLLAALLTGIFVKVLMRSLNRSKRA